MFETQLIYQRRGLCFITQMGEWAILARVFILAHNLHKNKGSGAQQVGKFGFYLTLEQAVYGKLIAGTVKSRGQSQLSESQMFHEYRFERPARGHQGAKILVEK